MRSLYPFRWPLIVLLAGYFVRLVGLLFKIRHWPMADELITAGFVVMMIAVIWLIISLLSLTAKERHGKKD